MNKKRGKHSSGRYNSVKRRNVPRRAKNSRTKKQKLNKKKVFAVIVPSFGMENYPTTAIEGIYGKCVVCGSNRGGVPELISEQKLLFDVEDAMDLKRCLMELNKMSDKTYKMICKRQMEMFNKNNTPEVYLNSLTELFKELSV